MQLDRLLSDAVNMPEGTSRRQQQIKLTEMLQERHGSDSITYKGVAKWFERGSVPAVWLMRIAQLPKKPLNLATYA
jgi:hypothetical protein